ncbi:CGNR zinc finger domain-containing protein [Nonomuraea sp. NPDC050536]|uniref:CGNR zinc finger domain-containing protein n=1 Tax=Nonomuraea sp. NPDC050536 TaxID=3364366 RepID=UPI0037C78B04
MFPFIGGRPCLNFVATLGMRHAVPVERLADTQALRQWISQAYGPAEPYEISAADLTEARTLREALHRVLTAAMRGQRPDLGDVETVNAAARLPDVTPQLGEGDVRWQGGGVRAVLSAVARDGILLVGGSLLDRVKKCENPDCSLLFLDDSQARRRRWCSMDRCGNQAKVAGYRARQASS